MQPTSSGTLQKFEPNTVLIRENELSRKMYIIHAGTVRVYKTYLGQKITLAILSKGEIFGEFSFFDAQPRSASVETLTDVEAYLIDGDVAKQQMQLLPDWVVPLLKSVFHRFRETDQKLAVMQSMSNFEKKHFRIDSMAISIYQELSRFTHALKLLYEKDSLEKRRVDFDGISSEMSQVLGQKQISLTSFFKVMQENEMIQKGMDEKSFTLNKPAIDQLLEHLQEQLKNNSPLLLSHSGFALLKRIVTRLESEATKKQEANISFDEVNANTMTFLEEAITELLEKKLVQVVHTDQKYFVFNPSECVRSFFYQNILKKFDHSVTSKD